MITPLQHGSFFDDDHDDDEHIYPIEKMNLRGEGPMPAGKHRNARAGSRRTIKYRENQHRIAVTNGGITRRRRKKPLKIPVAFGRS